MDCAEAVELARERILQFKGQQLDLLTITPPQSSLEAVFLSKTVSKLTPFVGNYIENKTVQQLNLVAPFSGHGQWIRQDPDFPDTIFRGDIVPEPGFEIKGWLPLATEVTARFRESQAHFPDASKHVAFLAWIPENIICGKPVIVDVCVVDAKSVAVARDNHYFQPPEYLVLEPEDTSKRTRNLQQRNTNGYRWQGSPKKLEEARRVVAGWGQAGKVYTPDTAFQARIRDLQGRFKYRLDTNYAKVDRIAHSELEAFKAKVLATKVQGYALADWVKVLSLKDEALLSTILKERLDI